MRIIFLCGGLEPGRDGVGDYTRRLAGKLLEQGHEVAAVALADSNTEQQLAETQHLDGSSISVLRLPHTWPLQKRSAVAREWIDQFDPEWISLQFVCFSFHPKGLNFDLGGHLNLICQGRKLHVMVHELWVGEDTKSFSKEQVLGWLQKATIRLLFKTLAFDAVSTSNSFYQTCLAKIGVDAGQINIFSNLPVGHKPRTGLYDQLPGKVRRNRDQYLIASFFGTSDYRNPDLTIANLKFLAASTDKTLLVTHVGRATGVSNFFLKLSELLNLETHIFGECNDQDIADYFCSTDVGLSTYPKIVFEKSGSIAAMLNNGLPVLLLRDSFVTDERKIDWVEEAHRIGNLDQFMSQKNTFSDNYGVSQAAEKYIRVFESSRSMRIV
ncbi:glycosyltransferase family 4 protein [Hymenobacter nivis]|nr:glycosyltransferase family 4 protein [Hymenobacter nivis]